MSKTTCSSTTPLGSLRRSCEFLMPQCDPATSGLLQAPGLLPTLCCRRDPMALCCLPAESPKSSPYIVVQA